MKNYIVTMEVWVKVLASNSKEAISIAKERVSGVDHKDIINVESER